MNFTLGEDRLLFMLTVCFLPIGCLTAIQWRNLEFIDTTTRDNEGWTSRPVMQSYNLSFSGLAS
jgi:hypothetical protein